jgi:hypothetical protein
MVREDEALKLNAAKIFKMNWLDRNVRHVAPPTETLRLCMKRSHGVSVQKALPRPSSPVELTNPPKCGIEDSSFSGDLNQSF